MLLNKVNVAVKCRPVSATEMLEETIDFFHNDKNTITTPKSKFTFKYLFKTESTPRDVFESLINPMLDKTLLGFNGTVLAYGQTGSGKTYTLGTESNHHQGITQMVLKHLFDIPGLQLKISVLEIYLKDCYDLLYETPLKINIQGLKPISVTLRDADNLEAAMQLLMSAVKNRRVGATASNKQSSRSHMIVSLYIETSNSVSKFNIVDLAGSEKIQASAGILRNEGVAINEALLSLGRVVNCLALAKSHIPFRDSPLTHLLEDSLKKENYITLIACVNSLRKNQEESEKTLEFASKFAGISASRVIIGTPFKTPSRFFGNNTFTSSNVFKKPLTPFNKTIATTPVSGVVKKKEQPQRELNLSNGSLNLSDVSTSTALPDSPPFRMNSVSSVLNVAYNAATMTPANLDNFIKTTVERAIKYSIKKEMSQIFKRQLNAVDQKENAHAQSPPSDESSDSDCLQTTVLGQCEDLEISESEALPCQSESEPPSKIPKISSNSMQENLNGSYISDFDSCSPNIQRKEPDQPVHAESTSSVFKKPPPRRSARLSIMKSSFEGTPYSNANTGSSLSSAPDSEVFRKPQVRRHMRGSVTRRAFEESDSDEAFGNRGDGDADYSSNCATDSEVFKRPQIRRFVKRPVVRRDHEETESDDAFENRADAGVFSEAEVSKRAPRRSMRLSIKRPVESESESLVSKVRRRSLGVALTKLDNLESEPNNTRGRKAANSANSTGSHEKRILKILQEGSMKDLLQLPTVGQKTAALILNDRLLRGPLKTVKDFAKIRGVTSNHGKKFLWSNSLD